jgi:uncharacterized delta-60 repeat protein
VAVQPDGKLLVAGSSTLGAGKTDFIVVRFLNPQGTGDPSFGSANGGALVDFGGTDFGSAMVLQPDGKILLAGTTDVMNSRRRACLVTGRRITRSGRVARRSSTSAAPITPTR